MPIYEYQCESCGDKIELLQKVGDSAPEVCACGERDSLIRVISAPAIQFKGSGWYVTDYADKGRNKEQGNGEQESKKPKESAGKDSDSKSTEKKSSESKSSAPAKGDK